MTSFLSIRQSVKLTGKSESTIKRLIREITVDQGHADRARIQPNHEQVMEHRAANKKYRWTVSEDLLRERFMQEKEMVLEPAMKRNEPSGDDLTVLILREQLRSKDEQFNALEKQLDRKDEQIGRLNEHLQASSERMRESNLIMNGLQQKLEIDSPDNHKQVVEKASDSVKRGLLQRFFKRTSQAPVQQTSS